MHKLKGEYNHIPEYNGIGYNWINDNNSFKREYRFPEKFKKSFKLSGLTVRQIAGLLNIKFRRLSNLMYNKYSKMDFEEYKKFISFCELIEKNNE